MSLTREQEKNLWGKDTPAEEASELTYNFKCMMALLNHVKTPSGNIIDARFLALGIAYHLVKCGFRYDETKMDTNHLIDDESFTHLSDKIGQWTPTKTMSENAELFSGITPEMLDTTLKNGWDHYTKLYWEKYRPADRIEKF